MFGIGLPELMTLVVLAVIFFGPEKIPEYSRKAARIVFFLRGIANNAQNQLRAELGPEYADLQLTDLNPKTFVQKHVLDAIQADLDDIRADIDDVRNEVDSSARDARMLTEDVRHELEHQTWADEVEQKVPFDADAT